MFRVELTQTEILKLLQCIQLTQTNDIITSIESKLKSVVLQQKPPEIPLTLDLPLLNNLDTNVIATQHPNVNNLVQEPEMKFPLPPPQKTPEIPQTFIQPSPLWQLNINIDSNETSIPQFPKFPYIYNATLQSNSPSLIQLNNDILSEILSYLPSFNIFQFSLVSKQCWHATNSEKLWKFLTLKEFPEVSEMRVPIAIPEESTVVRSIFHSVVMETDWCLWKRAHYWATKIYVSMEHCKLYCMWCCGDTKIKSGPLVCNFCEAKFDCPKMCDICQMSEKSKKIMKKLRRKVLIEYC